MLVAGRCCSLAELTTRGTQVCGPKLEISLFKPGVWMWLVCFLLSSWAKFVTASDSAASDSFSSFHVASASGSVLLAAW